MTQSAADEIDAHGGPAKFAEAIGQTPGVVRAWKHRGIIPRSAWPEIIEAFPDLTLARLKQLEQHQKGADSSDEVAGQGAPA